MTLKRWNKYKRQVKYTIYIFQRVTACHNNNPAKIAKLLIMAGIKIILSLDFNPHFSSRKKL
jgi:hypothetical protein